MWSETTLLNINPQWGPPPLSVNDYKHGKDSNVFETVQEGITSGIIPWSPKLKDKKLKIFKNGVAISEI